MALSLAGRGSNALRLTFLAAAASESGALSDVRAHEAGRVGGGGRREQGEGREGDEREAEWRAWPPRDYDAGALVAAAPS